MFIKFFNGECVYVCVMCVKIMLMMMLFIDNGDLVIEMVLGGGSEGVE